MSSPAKSPEAPAASRQRQPGQPTIDLEELRRRAVVTVDEAAALLQTGRSATYEACRRRQLPTIRIGRKLRIPAAALLRMLDAEPDDGSD